MLRYGIKLHYHTPTLQKYKLSEMLNSLLNNHYEYKQIYHILFTKYIYSAYTIINIKQPTTEH